MSLINKMQKTLSMKVFARAGVSVLALSLFINPSLVLAATSGPNDAGTGTNVNGPGSVAWAATGNITADDTNYATANLGNSATSEYIQGTNYGFAIPADATINGITVSIMRQSSANTLGNSTNDVDLNLLKAGAIVGTDKAVSTDWPTSMTIATYGGAADLWGTTWTPAEVNASNFGVSLSVANQSPYTNRTASVDYIQITVTYTAPVDNTAPVIAQVTEVPNPTSDNTPSYTFSSTEAGIITYGGTCGNADLVSATAGNNTITYGTLSGTHSNCTITVKDAANNTSNLLAVNTFTINTDLFNKGMVTLSFDDGLKSTFDNIGLLGSFKSTQYVYTVPMFGATVCDGACYEDFMTIANVESLYSAGHEIAAHTRSHISLAPASAVERLFETDGARLDLLQEIGIPVNSLAYPFGESNADAITKLQSAGFVGARTVNPDELNSRSTNRYDLFARQVETGTLLSEVQSWIDEAVLNKEWLVLVFHEITADCGADPYCVTPSTLSGVVSYLTAQGSNVDVVTMAQGLAQMNNNPVSNPGVPVITQDNITVEATSPAGASVPFSPVVTDDDTGLVIPLNAFCTIPNAVPDPESGLIFPTIVVSGDTFAMGTTTVTCTAADTGGRVGTKAFDIGVVNVAVPSVIITTTVVSPTNVSPIPVTATFSESVTGLTQGDIVVTNGSAGNLAGSDSIYTFDVITSADGEVTVNIPAGSAQDVGGAGNLATTSLSVIYDHTAPELSITDGPADASTIPTNITSFSFTVLGQDTLECKLDSEAYAPCVSPVELSSLTEGAHTFMVRASDIAGNSTEVSRTFTVDTLPPTLLEVTPVPSPASITPSYTFSSSEAGTITYSGSCSSVTTEAVSGNNTIVFNTLVGGTYSDCTITVTDASAHVSEPLAVNEFTVDDSAPVITVNAQPNVFINTTNTDINFTVTDALTVVCSLDTVANPCESDVLVSLTGLSEAPHEFVIVATDEVGNAATSTINFTVDLTGPVLTVNSQITNDTTPTVTGTTNDSADVSVTVNAVEYLTTPVLGVWSVTIPSENSLADGEYPVSANSTDAAGNSSNLAEGSLTINTQAPDLTLDPIAPNATAVTGTTEPSGVTVAVAVTDSELNGNSYNASVDGAGVWSATITDLLAEGVYNVTVTATDELGNVATIPSTLTVDVTGPVLTLVGIDPVDVNLNGIYNEEGATGVDNIDPTVTVVVGGDVVDTSVLAAEYNVTYSATDTSGNSSGITRVVRIKDLEAPVLTLNGESPMNLAVGQAYVELSATGVDNVDASVEVTVGGDTVNTEAVGTYFVTYDAVDAAGNAATQITRTVVVSDLVVSAEQTGTPATNSITVTWTTSHPSTSRVVYDTVSHSTVTEPAPNYGYANSTVENATLVTEHSVTVEGLTAGTTYFLRPVSHGSPEILGNEVTLATEKAPVVETSSGGGSHRSGGDRNPNAFIVSPIVGQVLGAFTSGDQSQIEAIKAQLIVLIQQLIVLLQAEIDAQLP